MSSVIRTNQPNFFGKNADVVANGFIYIGEPYKAPQNFPKTVTFQDSAGGQFTASQPLRTNSQGQISYQGNAIIALVDGDYSMLVLDQNEKEIPDGYIPFIEGVTSSESNNNTQWARTLSAVKALSVVPGNIVANVGKNTFDDGEGAWWFIVSDTGSAGDDLDLIDINNGTQGKRIQNPLYQVKNLSDLPDKEAARTNLDVYSTSEVYNTTETYNNTEVYTKTEVDDGFQDEVSDVSGYDKANSFFIAQDDKISSTFGTTSGAFFTVGPTGSASNIIWSALDDLPSDAKFIEFRVSDNSGTTSTIEFRNEGSTITYDYAQADFVSGDAQPLVIKIPLESAGNIFRIRTAQSTTLELIGFGV